MTKVSRVKSFAVCWVHQVCGEKFCDFYHHHLHTFMVYQLYKTATSVSTKASCSSREFSLKLSLAYSEMDESTLLKHVSHFPGWPWSHRRRRAKVELAVEVSPRWNRPLTASLLVSLASYFLISWQKPSRFFTTKWSKSLAGKTFVVY